MRIIIKGSGQEKQQVHFATKRSRFAQRQTTDSLLKRQTKHTETISQVSTSPPLQTQSHFAKLHPTDARHVQMNQFMPT